MKETGYLLRVQSTRILAHQGKRVAQATLEWEAASRLGSSQDSLEVSEPLAVDTDLKGVLLGMPWGQAVWGNNHLAVRCVLTSDGLGTFTRPGLGRATTWDPSLSYSEAASHFPLCS